VLVNQEPGDNTSLYYKENRYPKIYSNAEFVSAQTGDLNDPKIYFRNMSREITKNYN
jgi:hypothetical protein